MKRVSNIVMKLLGTLLLTAGALKGWQLLGEPVPNSDIWSYRPFLILTVESELALGIWLLSGLFRKAAWLAALLCFSVFSAITLYKGLIGAESCGCFGSVRVNPWITLGAVDVPSVTVLMLFRPAFSFPGNPISLKNIAKEMFAPLPSMPQVLTKVGICIVLLATTATVLALNEPAKSTPEYEVLGPETWVGKSLPIIDYIDIGASLEKGQWIVLLYHSNCPECREALSRLEQLARDWTGNNDRLRKVAIIEVPPYGRVGIHNDSACVWGKLADGKKWFVRPSLIHLSSGMVKSAWTNASGNLSAIVNCFSVAKQSCKPRNASGVVRNPLSVASSASRFPQIAATRFRSYCRYFTLSELRAWRDHRYFIHSRGFI